MTSKQDKTTELLDELLQCKLLPIAHKSARFSTLDWKKKEKATVIYRNATHPPTAQTTDNRDIFRNDIKKSSDVSRRWLCADKTKKESGVKVDHTTRRDHHCPPDRRSLHYRPLPLFTLYSPTRGVPNASSMLIISSAEVAGLTLSSMARIFPSSPM